MAKRITRIAPWQAAKLFAVIYFFLSLLFVVPMALIAVAIPPLPSNVPHIPVGVLLFLPFLYALFGLLFVALGCWMYNTAAKFVGGVVVTVTDDGEV